MNAKDIHQICLWLSNGSEYPITPDILFLVAYRSAKNIPDEDDISDADKTYLGRVYHAFMTDGVIPDFIKSFWYQEILPKVLKRG